MSHTSLELLLIAAVSCLATALKNVIRKHQKKNMSQIQVTAEGVRRNGLPTDFEKMAFHVRCTSPNLNDAELGRLVQSTKRNICPVFAMLRDDIDTELSSAVIRPTAQTEGHK
ncbi:MAG: OsmC family protein [Deltaproteobacteria bacterium]|nr:OsmC family protein [Deltaproteobacteria bacterium]